MKKAEERYLLIIKLIEGDRSPRSPG